MTGLSYQGRVSKTEYALDLAGIFVRIGVLPNTQWLDGAVVRNRIGEIAIDAKC